MKRKLKRAVAAAAAIAVGSSVINYNIIPVQAETNSGTSSIGERSYSSAYTEITTLKSYNDRGKDGWRNGLVAGNGENGLIESCGSAEDVMIFQNIKFGYPTNAIRVTPDMSSVRDNTIQDIIEYKGEYLSAAGAQKSNDEMLGAASNWVKSMNLAGRWDLQNTYAFHPAHQLRLKMNNSENGSEKAYERYTDYQTAEIGTNWTDADNNVWERKSFASREDNVNVTSLTSISGAKINMTISVDDIARMSNEGGVDTQLADIRYRKVVSENGDYIGWAAHYPYYHNSTLNNGGAAGITRIIVSGDNASKEYVFGSETADSYANPVGGAAESVINLGYDKSPSVNISNADAVYLITKTERDKTGMGTLGAFENQDNTKAAIKDGSEYAVVKQLTNDTAAAAEKYSTKADYSDFDYAKALEPSAKKHYEIFNRLNYSVCITDEDKAMRSYTNEQLIAAQKASKTKLLPAMLERLYYNGRFANICCSGIQAPRLGGMWTGAWGCEWSGDYTTDANINLQVAGANIGSVPEETVGFINVMLKNLTDWELNARQIYGIENAIMAPSRTDGDSAVMCHFSNNFPGQMWLSGANWLIQPIYEYYQCYGNQNIPLTPDMRKELEFTGNKYAGYTEITDKYGTEGAYHDYGIKDSSGNTIVYNLRNTLCLSDERTEQILKQGYLDLEKDVLHPMLTKTANFWLGFVNLKYYTKDAKAYYDAEKTELADDESYLIAPGYSPENAPKNTNKSFTANAVMDIASSRDTLKAAIEIEKNISGLSQSQENVATESYEAYINKLPPYLYEQSGELKEWALADYTENFGHRHGSQLYGLWPGFEGETDARLFDGATRLIETKNAIPSSDNKSGHGWLHRGLVMARLKNGAGVRDTLLPLTANNMIYSSMMMSHNNDMSAAYCTDPVITIPAIELETLVYSDENTIELLPAMLPELENGGEISGTTGITIRNGGAVTYLNWNENSVKAKLKNSNGAKLKLKEGYDTLSVNGVDVTSQLKRDETGDCYYTISTDDEISVEYTLSDMQNGTYSLNNNAEKLSVTGADNNSEVSFAEPADNRMGLWNAESVTNNGFKFINTYTGKALTFNGEKLVQQNYNGGNNQIWVVSDSSITSLSGYTQVLTEIKAEAETSVQTVIDSITVTADNLTVKNGLTLKLDAACEPTGSAASGYEWIVERETGNAAVDSNGILTARAVGTVKVYAKAKIGSAESEKLTINIEPSGLENLGDDITVWADEAIAAGGLHQGSNGDTAKNDFGNMQNTDEVIKEFFPDAQDGDKIGEYTRVNALDNSGGSWAGYIYVTVNAANSGTYPLYILCNTNITSRAFEITNTTNSSSSISLVDAEQTYSTSNWLKVGTAAINLEEGENVLKIQAPSQGLAPNFIAIKLKGAGPITGSVDLANCYTGYVSGEKGDGSASYCDASGKAYNLFDGDTTTVNDAARKAITFFDVSKFAPYIKKIEYSINGTSNAAANFLYGAYGIDDNCNTGSVSSVSWETIYRTNGTKASGLTIKSSTIDTTAGTGTAVLTGDFSKWNYIGVANGSGNCKCSELKIYLSDDSEELPTLPPTAVPTATPAPTANPTPAPTETPIQFDIVSYDTAGNEDGTVTLNNAVVRNSADETLKLYAAVYDNNGVLKALKCADAPSGENKVDIGITANPENAVKIFLWGDMNPKTEVKSISLTKTET